MDSHPRDYDGFYRITTFTTEEHEPPQVGEPVLFIDLPNRIEIRVHLYLKPNETSEEYVLLHQNHRLLERDEMAMNPSRLYSVACAWALGNFSAF